MTPEQQASQELFGNPDWYVGKCLTGQQFMRKDGSKIAWPALVELYRQEADGDRLRAAVEAVYFAAHWMADRPCDASALWTELRDAAGIEPGQTAARLPAAS